MTFNREAAERTVFDCRSDMETNRASWRSTERVRVEGLCDHLDAAFQRIDTLTAGLQELRSAVMGWRLNQNIQVISLANMAATIDALFVSHVLKG